VFGDLRFNASGVQRFQVPVQPDSRRWEWRDWAPDKAARDMAFTVFERLASFDPLDWGAALSFDPLDWGAAPPDDLAKFPHFRFNDEAQAVLI
jgi:hypothetical protein